MIANKKAALLFLCALSACAIPPRPIPYGPAAAQNGVGYSDKKVSDNQYAIQVYGYPGSSMDEVEDIFNRRAKELCKSSSFKRDMRYDNLSSIKDGMLYSANGIPVFIPTTKSQAPFISGTVTCK